MLPVLSIVIPTFNEAENIKTLITHLQKNDPGNLAEIIISDAQSEDETVKIATAAGVKVYISPNKGRAAQMNYGALFCKADILYFVHADTFPPETFVQDITMATQCGYGFGRYRTKFNSNNILLKINQWFTRFDLFICYGGDQTLFMTKKLFNTIGGFNNTMQIMEDYDIVTRAKQFSKYKIFKKPAYISARKYDTNSWLKISLANLKIVKMYKRGAPQNAMIKKYKELIIYR